MQNPVLVEVLRGGWVESVHRGSIAVVDDHGRTLWSCGDVERPIFPRSAVKLLQALPLVASGAADALGLTSAELALACASHGGQAVHTAAAASMLAKAGVDAAALECGTHWPSHEASQRELSSQGLQPNALHNNCSGKHAGFVCLACGTTGHRGAALLPALQGYVEPDHPVMRAVSAALRETTDWNLETSALGTDGCSIPTHAIPLRHLALAFARVGTGHGLTPAFAQAARHLRSAIAAHPLMVAGTGRFDTRVMEHLGERLCCKVGAEGVYCASVPERGWGVAIKMDDGNNARAVEVVMGALLQPLLRLQGEDAQWAQAQCTFPLKNWQGREVGGLQPSDSFADALQALQRL